MNAENRQIARDSLNDQSWRDKWRKLMELIMCPSSKYLIDSSLPPQAGAC